MFAIVEEEADVDVEAEEEVGLEALVKSEKSEEKTPVRILLFYHKKFNIFTSTGTLSLVICILTLNAPIATKVFCFSHLLKCFRSLYGKQCGPRSDCSYGSSLFWVHAVCFYTLFVSNVRQFFAADDIFRCIFFLALKVKVESVF